MTKVAPKVGVTTRARDESYLLAVGRRLSIDFPLPQVINGAILPQTAVHLAKVALSLLSTFTEPGSFKHVENFEYPAANKGIIAVPTSLPLSFYICHRGAVPSYN